MEEKEYDVIIIGAGVAGLSAGIYTARYRLKTLILDEMPGGVTKTAHLVENYPGFESITGDELAEKFKSHAEKSGAVIFNENVVSIKKVDEKFVITTNHSNEYLCSFILISTGSKRKRLGIVGEDRLYGRGISYCATCDAAFFKDKIAAVVGGGNSASMATVLLSEYASKVYMIYRGSELKGEPVWNQRVLNNPKIEVIFNTNVTEAFGQKKLEKIKTDNGREIDLSGLFVEIGSLPAVEMARMLGVEITDKGLINVTVEQRTNVEGVYAAGDVTTGSAGFQQIITAASEGSVAAYDIFKKKNMKSRVNKTN